MVGMLIVLLDAHRPTLIPADIHGRVTRPVTYSTGVPTSVRTLVDAIATDGTDGTHVTVDANEARGHADVIRVDDPLNEARRVMSTARSRGEWEAAQTHASLLPYLEEEAGEFADAVRAGAAEDELKKELGDVFLQVLFHAEIAAERGAFDLDEVAESFTAKMRSRAPYLFDGSTKRVGVDEQNELWAAGKRAERG